jgi:arylsulfatase A-like enzyme
MFRRLLDSPWPYFVGAGILLVVLIASQFEIRVPPRPVGTIEDIPKLRERDDLNVVFITIDTLRADHLGAYGYGRPTSANLDALAATGILFRNVFAQSSWTKTSMASLWTGTSPLNHGILRFEDVLPEQAVLPAEILKQAGWRTAGVWRNGWVAPNFGFAQGFDFYVNPRPGRSRMVKQSAHPAGASLDGSDEDSLVSAFEFLDRFGHERFFLYLHLMDLHQYTYDDQAPQFGTGYVDAYDQALHWTDRVVALLYGHLEEIGQLQNTIIAITSDHGEAFREHGTEGHARNLYSEVVTVPWIIALPFRLDPGIVVDQRVTNMDVWPTLLDLLGLEGLANPDGRSLVPLILVAGGMQTDGLPPQQPVVSYLDRDWGRQNRTNPLISVTDGDTRVMLWPRSPDRNQLFDLKSDPGEQHDRFDPDDPETQRMLELVRQHTEGATSPWDAERETIELDALRLNQLRALGYVVR